MKKFLSSALALAVTAQSLTCCSGADAKSFEKANPDSSKNIVKKALIGVGIGAPVVAVAILAILHFAGKKQPQNITSTSSKELNSDEIFEDLNVEKEEQDQKVRMKILNIQHAMVGIKFGTIVPDGECKNQRLNDMDLSKAYECIVSILILTDSEKIQKIASIYEQRLLYGAAEKFFAVEASETDIFKDKFLRKLKEIWNGFGPIEKDAVMNYLAKSLPPEDEEYEEKVESKAGNSKPIAEVRRLKSVRAERHDYVYGSDSYGGMNSSTATCPYDSELMRRHINQGLSIKGRGITLGDEFYTGRVDYLWRTVDPEGGMPNYEEGLHTLIDNLIRSIEPVNTQPILSYAKQKNYLPLNSIDIDSLNSWQKADVTLIKYLRENWGNLSPAPRFERLYRDPYYCELFCRELLWIQAHPDLFNQNKEKFLSLLASLPYECEFAFRENIILQWANLIDEISSGCSKKLEPGSDEDERNVQDVILTFYRTQWESDAAEKTAYDQMISDHSDRNREPEIKNTVMFHSHGALNIPASTTNFNDLKGWFAQDQLRCRNNDTNLPGLSDKFAYTFSLFKLGKCAVDRFKSRTMGEEEKDPLVERMYKSSYVSFKEFCKIADSVNMTYSYDDKGQYSSANSPADEKQQIFAGNFENFLEKCSGYLDEADLKNLTDWKNGEILLNYRYLADTIGGVYLCDSNNDASASIAPWFCADESLRIGHILFPIHLLNKGIISFS